MTNLLRFLQFTHKNNYICVGVICKKNLSMAPEPPYLVKLTYFKCKILLYYKLI